MNKYFLIATLLIGFIMFPLMIKSAGCKLQGGTPVHTSDPVNGSAEMVCAGG